MNPQNLTTLSDYVSVLKRRAWIIVLCVVVAGASAYLYTKHETPEYKATGTVGLSQNPIQAQLTGQKMSQVDMNSYVAHQVDIANSKAVAAATLKDYKSQLAAQGLGNLTADDLISKTSVTGDATNVQLIFTATGKNRPQAEALMNSYLKEYVKTASAADLAFLNGQVAPLQKSINTLKAQVAAATARKDNASANVYGKQLIHAEDQMNTLTGLKTLVAGSRTEHLADNASKVKPVEPKNIAIGVALGLVIGLALIGLTEALDNRVRRSEDLSAALGMPMLAKIPTPPRTFRKGNRLAMMEDEQNAHAEAYRKLRTNFDFANLATRARVVMLSSAVEQEGKSTTISNLAVAFARADRKVALVDLDLRRPALNQFFGIDSGFGVTDVALGHVEAARALHEVPIPGASGSLEVMPTGPLPPHPADFLEAPAVGELLRELAQTHDIVLVDAAPILPVSDSVILSKQVDAIVVVARASTLKRHVLAEFHHALAALPVTKLGFILTAAEEETSYGGYGGYSGYGQYTAYPQGAPAEQQTQEPADVAVAKPSQEPRTRPAQ